MRRSSVAWKRVSLEPELPVIAFSLTPGAGALTVVGRAGSIVRATEGENEARRWLHRLIDEEDDTLMLTGGLLM